MNFSTKQSKNFLQLKLISLFFISITCLFFYNLGNRTFANPDESRYVEISKEMNNSGDFITPTLNGVKYLEKPPLFYWLQASNIKIFGINFYKQRITQAIIGLLGILATFSFLKKIYTLKIAYISSVVLSTSLLYFLQSRFINLDLLLSVLMAISLFCYSLAIINSIKPKLFIKLFYAFLALACLAKGLIGIILPAVIILSWITLSQTNIKNKINIIKKSIDPYGIAIFLVIALPWHIACYMANPDFIDFYIIHEHFHRYTTLSHNRFQPWYFFILIIIGGLIPWTGFLFGKLNYFKKIQSDENFKFLFIWASVITLFFSFSNSKLIPYILPIFFPLASIIGIFINSSFNEKNNYLNTSYTLNITLLTVILIYFFIYANKLNFNLKEFLNTISIAITLLTITWITIQKLNIKNQKHYLFIIYTIFAVYFMLIATKILPYAQEVSDKKSSSYKIAQNIKLNLTDQVEVFCYNDYMQDLPIYLNKNIGTIDFYGELEFGINHLNPNNRFLSETDFFKKFKSAKHRIFVCMKRSKFNKFLQNCDSEYKIIEVTKDFVVLINR